MSPNSLSDIAQYIVSNGKGILAADESTGTIKKRFDSINTESTEQSRKTYREMLFQSDGMKGNIGGVILFEETLKQISEDGTSLVKVISNQGALPGIKVDKGAKDFSNHPNEKISQTDFYSFAAFFAELKRKGTGISPPISAGTEYFYHSPGGKVMHPVTGQIMTPAPLGGTKLITPSGKDPRSTLANWMIVPDNPYFAKAMVNRIWGQFFGRGIVHPVDDFRASNPPVNPDILDALANDFSNNGYDLKDLMKRIMESRLYQLSSTPNDTNLEDTRSFSRFYRRRFSAENLEDIIGIEILDMEPNNI